MPEQVHGCPVHAGFDPLSDEFLADPYAVLDGLPARSRRCSTLPPGAKLFLWLADAVF